MKIDSVHVHEIDAGLLKDMPNVLGMAPMNFGAQLSRNRAAGYPCGAKCPANTRAFACHYDRTMTGERECLIEMRKNLLSAADRVRAHRCEWICHVKN